MMGFFSSYFKAAPQNRAPDKSVKRKKYIPRHAHRDALSCLSSNWSENDPTIYKRASERMLARAKSEDDLAFHGNPKFLNASSRSSSFSTLRGNASYQSSLRHSPSMPGMHLETPHGFDMGAPPIPAIPAQWSSRSSSLAPSPTALSIDRPTLAPRSTLHDRTIMEPLKRTECHQNHVTGPHSSSTMPPLVRPESSSFQSMSNTTEQFTETSSVVPMLTAPPSRLIAPVDPHKRQVAWAMEHDEDTPDAAAAEHASSEAPIDSPMMTMSPARRTSYSLYPDYIRNKAPSPASPRSSRILPTTNNTHTAIVDFAAPISPATTASATLYFTPPATATGSGHHVYPWDTFNSSDASSPSSKYSAAGTIKHGRGEPSQTDRGHSTTAYPIRTPYAAPQNFPPMDPYAMQQHVPYMPQPQLQQDTHIDTVGPTAPPPPPPARKLRSGVIRSRRPPPVITPRDV